MKSTAPFRVAVFALVLVAGIAHADDVSITVLPVAPFTAASQAALAAKYRAKGLPPSVNYPEVTPISINPYAINATVIKATIKGKVYRFVGKSSTNFYYAGAGGFVTLDSWKGTTPDGETAQFEFRDARFLYGYLEIDSSGYTLYPDALVDPKIGWTQEIRDATRMAWVQRNAETNFVRSTGPLFAYVGYCDSRRWVAYVPMRNCEDWRAGGIPK